MKNNPRLTYAVAGSTAFVSDLVEIKVNFIQIYSVVYHTLVYGDPVGKTKNVWA